MPIVTAIKIIFLLGFLILIHETGHFIVAKLCKIKVNEFAIGFGPKIWSKEKGETTYEIRLIPLGGFVRLEGEEELTYEEGSFNKASIPKRIAVISAGALVNILFGIFVYAIIIAIKYMGTVNSNFLDAFIYGIKASGELMIEMAKGLASLFTGQFSLDNMTGPVGISSLVAKTNGIAEFMYLLSIISISLGVTNLLPFVPLDGGKNVLLILEAIRGKPLKPEIEIKLQTIGFFILILFSIIVTFHDIGRLGGG